MDFVELLRGRDCGCGKHHSCEVETIIIKPGAVRELSKLLAPYSSVVLAADEHTYGVCGDAVKEQTGTRWNGFLYLRARIY